MGKYSIVAISLAFLGVALAQQLTHDERCQVLEGNGIRVDQCSSEKFLACKDGRCQCADPVNQIYTYREELITRSKRSPKGGKGFKKIAVGAVAGAATYHVASQASKGFKVQTTESPKKYKRVYACYSRVGGQCAFSNVNWQSVDSSSSSTTSTSTTTTEPATTLPSSTGSENVTSSSNTTSEAISTNGTTTTTSAPAPVAAAQTQPLDVSKIPGCVQNAVCKHGSPTQGNGTSSSFLQKVDYDPRLGVCECESGYEKTTKDICVKVKKSGASEKTVAGAVILAALVFNKIFAF
ncbi:unnamed protein product [Orchesella dallaii]|uniref:Uncharacterized protein n=1 Tax=Orchesella dallaii TaxID=48710 RepID=A0ABP1Q7B7_9HEXA